MTKEDIQIFIEFGCSPEMAAALAQEDAVGIARCKCRESGGSSAKIMRRIEVIEDAVKGGDIKGAIIEYNLLVKRANKLTNSNSHLKKELKRSIKTVMKKLRVKIMAERRWAKAQAEAKAAAEAARAAELAFIEEMKKADEAASEALTEAIIDSVAEEAAISFEEAAHILERVEASFKADKKAARKAAKKAAKEAAAAEGFIKQSIIETALAVEYDVSVEDIRSWKKIAEDHKVSLGRYLYFREFVQEASDRYGLEVRKCWKEFWRAVRVRFKSFEQTLKTFVMFVACEVKVLPKVTRKTKVRPLTKKIIQRRNGKIKVFHYPID